MEKRRAPRNRTIVLTEADRERLGPRLVSPENLGSLEDATVCGDLFRVLPLLPDAFADLIVADPPYNLSKEFGGYRFAARGEEAYEEYLRSWLPDVVRCLKPDGSMYVCCDWRSSASVHRVLSGLLTVRNRITWQREKGRGAASNWKNAMEDIWYAVKDPNRFHFDLDAVKVRRRVLAPYRVNGAPKDWEETPQGNFRLTHPSNFWDDISVPYWSMPENTDHPTQKPEKLVAKLILASSRPGDMVFDPFLGSGTTSVVARKLGRRFLGVEMNEQYAMLALRRLEMAEERPAIQGYEDGVFWERNSR